MDISDPTPSTQPSSHSTDPNTLDLDTLLHLESQYYAEGYALGLTDGSRAGRIEGRLFGLEQGFKKFAEIGRLSGRANVWQARLNSSHTQIQANDGSAISPLKGGERLKRHVERLAELTDGESLETKNEEDAVNEADERLAGAKAKFMMVSRIVGEDEGGSQRSLVKKEGRAEGGGVEVEIDASGKPKKDTGEMEDFMGLPQLKQVKVVEEGS